MQPLLEQKYQKQNLCFYCLHKFQTKKFGVYKGPLSGLRQFLAIENPLKMMKNGFTLKAIFILEIFKFLS